METCATSRFTAARFGWKKLISIFTSLFTVHCRINTKTKRILDRSLTKPDVSGNETPLLNS
ncbi:hypothetical protein CU097_001419, partial [Rhizopus azygosporus]